MRGGSFRLGFMKWLSRVAADRTTPRRDVELVCICQDFLGRSGPGITVTVAKSEGISRRVIHHDGSLHGLTAALHKAADWIASGAVRVEGVSLL